MRRALPVLLLLIACDGRVQGLPEPEPSGTVRVPGPVTTPPVPTSSSEPDPGLPPPTGPSPEAYSAGMRLGSLSALNIYKADYATDSCIIVEVRAPGDPVVSDYSYPAVAVPDGWTVATIVFGHPAASCHEYASAQLVPDEIVTSYNAKGSIKWSTLTPSQTVPCTVYIHAVVVSSGSRGAQQLDADNLSVAGCK
jgi:hypothetical protein